MMMETFTKENGLMIRLKDMEYMYIITEQNMKDNGRMTNNMAKVTSKVCEI